MGRTDSAARAAALAALEEARAERAAVDAQLKAVAESDPEALAELQAKARLAKAAADRWTDNVWALKAYLTDKFGKAPAECDAMLGIPDDFDYVT